MRAILPEQLATYFDSSPVALSLGRAEGDHELLLTNEGFRNLTRTIHEASAPGSCEHGLSVVG